MISLNTQFLVYQILKQYPFFHKKRVTYNPAYIKKSEQKIWSVICIIRFFIDDAIRIISRINILFNLKIIDM